MQKRFHDVAHAVIENRFKAPTFTTHSSINKEVVVNRQRSIKAKELPDAGFSYVKNFNVEKITKPDPELKLPKGIRYNIVIGSLQEFPTVKK